MYTRKSAHRRAVRERECTQIVAHVIHSKNKARLEVGGEVGSSSSLGSSHSFTFGMRWMRVPSGSAMKPRAREMTQSLAPSIWVT